MRSIRTTLAILWLALSASSVQADGTSYEYDELGRLKKVTYTVAGQPDRVIEYAYDPAGNRTEVVTSGEGLPPGTGGGQKVVVVPLNGFTIIPIPDDGG